MSTITERVAAGAAFLDANDPEWWREDVDRAIDLDTLAMADGHACILGQRCPLELQDYDREPYVSFGRRLSGLAAGGGYSIDMWGRPLGFACNHEVGVADLGCEWDALTAEWKRVITERRSA